jgi:hypothetical protein
MVVRAGEQANGRSKIERRRERAAGSGAGPEQQVVGAGAGRGLMKRRKRGMGRRELAGVSILWVYMVRLGGSE